jgi:hypothetical protein
MTNATPAELASRDPNRVPRAEAEEDLPIIRLRLGGIAMVDSLTSDQPAEKGEVEALTPAGEIEHTSLELGRIATRVVVGKPEKIAGTEGFYNPAAWRVGDKTYLLGRFIEMAGEGPASDKEQPRTNNGEPIVPVEPDVGPLVRKVLGPDGKIIPGLTREVWRPEVGKPSFEDFRALMLDDGRLIFGLTAVEDGIPYPAMLVTTTEKLNDGTPIEPQIIKALGGGDQTTPLGEIGSSTAGKNVTVIDEQTFKYRPQGPENRHLFRVFDIVDGSVTHRYDINLPKDKKWAQWAIGTCMSPEWTDKTKREAFMLIHGSSIVDEKYEYSIASARLFKDENGVLSIDNIDEDPLLTLALFEDVVQRHPGRDALYVVGGIPYRDEDGNLVRIDAYPSPGDGRTDKAVLDPREIIKNWKRPELAMADEFAEAV